VRTGDTLAQALITLGGIGTIVAVLLVGVFLLAVALPLFRSARARLEQVAACPFTSAELASLVMDDSAAVVWGVELPREGRDGGAVLVSVADGGVLARTTAAACGLDNATAIRTVPGARQAAVGYADGSIRTGSLGIESTFLDGSDLPAVARDLRRGAAIGTEQGAIVRADNGRYARVKVGAELAAATRSLTAAIADIDVTTASGGPLVAALDEQGRVRVESVTTRRNLLTDELVTVAVGSTIESTAGFTPKFVRVSEISCSCSPPTARPAAM
jgi:hypothetical protein